MSPTAGLKHLVFIVNPNSGTDRNKAIHAAIASELNTGVFSYELRLTERIGHGTELARIAADNGAYAVVAVGGDGSVADVAKGLVGSNTILGIIPKGSGNGFARSLNWPLNPMAAMGIINQQKTLTIDVGYVNDQLFLSNAGVGFDALIAQEFASNKRRGLRGYSWLVTKHLWQYREREWTIELEDEVLRIRAFLVNVANGQQFGYNFRIAPQASFTDAWLDLTVIKKFPRLLGGGLVWRASRGTIQNSRYVLHRRVKTLRISHPDLHLMQTDGDAHSCPNSLAFRIVPQALQVFVP